VAWDRDRAPSRLLDGEDTSPKAAMRSTIVSKRAGELFMYPSSIKVAVYVSASVLVQSRPLLYP
jgi:hypothetical protein